MKGKRRCRVLVLAAGASLVWLGLPAVASEPTTALVSVSWMGVRANGPSRYPAVSADGRFVAFSSRASNLVAGDANGKGDVFVHDRETGETTRVSVSSLVLPQHADEHRSERPVLLAMDQQLSDRRCSARFDPKTARHLGQCEYVSETDPAVLKVLLKVKPGLGEGYDWVECGDCGAAWQVAHYAESVG